MVGRPCSRGVPLVTSAANRKNVLELRLGWEWKDAPPTTKTYRGEKNRSNMHHQTGKLRKSGDLKTPNPAIGGDGDGGQERWNGRGEVGYGGYDALGVGGQQSEGQDYPGAGGRGQKKKRNLAVSRAKTRLGPRGRRWKKKRVGGQEKG